MKRRESWTQWLENMPANGRITFPIKDATRKASGEHKTVSQALRRAARDGWVTLLHRGLYAWVPPEYRKDMVPPFYWVIHAWMDFLSVPYYVGLLSAASLHGSAQQAPMEYQVMTARQVRSVKYGRGRVKFVTRGRWPDAGLLERKQGFQDSFFVSGPELTLLDLVKYPAHAGGWDNIATLAKDLGKSVKIRNLEIAIAGEETPVLQRLGWLLDYLGFVRLTKPILTTLGTEPLRKAVLEPGGSREGLLDERYQLRINYLPQVEL